MDLFILGRIFFTLLPWALVLFAAFLAGTAWKEAQGNARRQPLVFGLALALGALDWALVFALPRLGLSYGPVEATVVWLAVARMSITLAVALPLKPGMRWYPKGRRGLLRGGALAWLLLNLGMVAAEVDTQYIEPFRLTTTPLPLDAPAFLPDRPLRIVQLADTHIERTTRREREVLEQVKALQPDLIVLTGDYVSIDYLEDEQALQDTRAFLAQLKAPYGVYAVIGTVDRGSRIRSLLATLPLTVLNDEFHRVSLPGGELYIVGVENTGFTARDRAALRGLMARVPAGAYSLLLYHTPDVIDVAPAAGVDLYLAGHTHGGQVRLPFYGALITFSEFGKQYEMGRYTLAGPEAAGGDAEGYAAAGGPDSAATLPAGEQAGSTTLYVSRGLGLEGLGLPRIRFLCPPEIVVVELGPQ